MAGGLLLVAVFLLVIANLPRAMTYYYPVDQYVMQRAELGSRHVQVKGKVVPGSIRWNPVALDLRFVIRENGKEMPVAYQGLKPDTLQDDIEVVVAGRWEGDEFQAKSVMVKCPSRYISTENVGK